MLFNQLSFFIFIPIFLVLYYLIPSRFQKHFILVGNLIFVLCHGVLSLAALILMTVVGFYTGKWMGCVDGGKARKRKGILALSVILITMLLLFCKYAGVIKVSFIVPIGISFYSLRIIGYIVEVYRGSDHLDSFEEFLICTSYFPVLPAGPIENINKLSTELKKERAFDPQMVQRGLITMLYGYFMKFVIADRIAILVDAVYADIDGYPGYLCLLIVILYSIEIYCDFAGYSYIAIGLSRLLGIEVMTNFLRPYLAVGIRDFWRRWHISLSRWLRDNIYIPLGGNRKGFLRQNINLLLTFVISGIWHGFGWSFVIWGGLHGVYQIVENIFGKLFGRDKEKRNSFVWIKRIIVFVFVTIAWVFFRAENVGQAFQMFGHIFADPGFDRILDGSIYLLGWGRMQLSGIALSCLLLIVFEVLLEKDILNIDRFTKHPLWKRWSVCYITIIWIVIALVQIYGMNTEATFIYANF